MGTSDIYQKAQLVIRAWSTMRPHKTFFRMSVDDFKMIAAQSGEARSQLERLKTNLRNAFLYRDRADRLTARTVLRIVNAVKGDPDEGEDGELIQAMGYLPHTTRSAINSKPRSTKPARKEF